MKHVDPASEAFQALSPKMQARVLYFDIGWDEAAISDELDVSRDVLERWLDATMKVAKPRPHRTRNIPGRITSDGTASGRGVPCVCPDGMTRRARTYPNGKARITAMNSDGRSVAIMGRIEDGRFIPCPSGKNGRFFEITP
jgi:hypothetical protein